VKNLDADPVIAYHALRSTGTFSGTGTVRWYDNLKKIRVRVRQVYLLNIYCYAYFFSYLFKLM
jgi:hypothetical protein